MRKRGIKFVFILFYFWINLHNFAYCVLYLKTKLKPDDCFDAINVDGVQKFKEPIEKCDFDHKTKTENLPILEVNLHSIITYELYDDGKATGYCFIQNGIYLNEFYFDIKTSSDLWSCQDCGKEAHIFKKVLDESKLVCDGDFKGTGDEHEAGFRKYNYVFNIPSSIDEMLAYNPTVNHNFNQLNSLTYYSKPFTVITIDLDNLDFGKDGYGHELDMQNLYFYITVPNSLFGKIYYYDDAGNKIDLTNGGIYFSSSKLYYESPVQTYISEYAKVLTVDEIQLETCVKSSDSNKRASTSERNNINFFSGRSITSTTYENYKNYCPDSRSFITGTNNRNCGINKNSITSTCHTKCKDCEDQGNLDNDQKCSECDSYYEIYDTINYYLNCLDQKCNDNSPPLYFNGKNDTYECISNCNNRIINDYYCMDSCEYDDEKKFDEYNNPENKNCYNNCSLFGFYITSNDNKTHCVSNCSSTDKKYINPFDNETCVASCKEVNAYISSSDDICVPKCQENETISFDNEKCMSNCGNGTEYGFLDYNNENICLYNCSNLNYSYMSNDGKYCMEECKKDYSFINYNYNNICLKNCKDIGYIEIESNIPLCVFDQNNLNHCPNEYPFYNLDSLKCTKECDAQNIVNLTYCKSICHYETNLVKFCNYDINEFKKIIYNYQDITEFLKTFSIDEDFKTIHLNDSSYVQVYDINNQEYFNNKIDFISNINGLDTIKSYIISSNILSNDEKIFLVKVDYPEKGNYSQNVEYEFITNKYIKIQDILLNTFIEENTNIEKILKTENYNYTIAKNIYNLGFDIFNPEDILFNDVCLGFIFIDNVDTTFLNRRNYIYDPTNLCEENYIYNFINYTSMRVNCIKKYEGLKERKFKTINNILIEKNFSTIFIFTCYKTFFTMDLFSKFYIIFWLGIIINITNIILFFLYRFKALYIVNSKIYITLKSNITKANNLLENGNSKSISKGIININDTDLSIFQINKKESIMFNKLFNDNSVSLRKFLVDKKYNYFSEVFKQTYFDVSPFFTCYKERGIFDIKYLNIYYIFESFIVLYIIKIINHNDRIITNHFLDYYFNYIKIKIIKDNFIVKELIYTLIFYIIFLIVKKVRYPYYYLKSIIEDFTTDLTEFNSYRKKLSKYNNLILFFAGLNVFIFNQICLYYATVCNRIYEKETCVIILEIIFIFLIVLLFDLLYVFIISLLKFIGKKKKNTYIYNTGLAMQYIVYLK